MAKSSIQGLVSIVLVNKDCGAFVDVVFPSIESQTYPQVEVVVVDNGSGDGSLEQIRARAAGARIVELGRNAGFSGALNEGVQAARGEYVLSLNFDVVIEASFVAELVRALQERPDIGWAAGAMRQLGPDGPIDAIDCNGHYLLRSRYCYGCDPNRPDAAAYQACAEVFGASACAAFYRRDMLERLAVDGEIFDEDLFAYFEDIDVDWRAQRAGYRCLFVPAAKGAHMRGGTGLSKRPEVAALVLSNRFLVMAKNDDARDVLSDLVPILRRTLVDVGSHVRRGQGLALVLAAARVIRLAPRMWRKRRQIRKLSAGRESPARRFRIPSDFLG